MQKIGKILIATTATVCLLQAGGMQKYGVKSAKIEYEIKGSGNIMGMGKIKELGKKRLIFDNYGVQSLEEKSKVKKETIMGKTKVRKNHTLTYMNGAVVYRVDFKKKKIIRINSGAGAMAGMLAGGKNLKDNGEAMLKKMGGKKIGTNKVAGVTCDVWKIMGAKQCIYKGIPLKVEVNVMGVKSTEVATKAEFDISLSKDDFKLPDFPIYSINMNNGKQTKLNRDELEDMDKEDNKNIQAEQKETQDTFKEMGKALNKAGIKDLKHASKKQIENAMFPLMKKRILTEAQKAEDARDCISSASNLKEANKCVPRGRKKFDTWNDKVKNSAIKEINSFVSAVPCIKSANSMKAIETCMPRR